MENGPVFVNEYNKLSLRKYSWNKNCDVVYIDNPVGAGFSFTNSTDGYLRNQVDIGQTLDYVVRQLRILFQWQKREFYIAGESYGGKYVPAVSYHILVNNEKYEPNDRVNLKGIAIGNGVSDPVNQLVFGELFNQMGYIDSNKSPIFTQYENAAIALINQGNYTGALLYTFSLINTRTCLFNNLTGFTSPYNMLKPDGYNPEIAVVDKFFATSGIEKKLHVGNRTFVAFTDTNLVLYYLQNDILQSVAKWIEYIVDRIRVTMYCGNLDFLAGPKGWENVLNNLNHTGAAAYLAAPTTIWRVDGKVAGNTKVGGNLTHKVFYGAGHMVPFDKPAEAYDLISEVTGTGKYR